MRQNSASGRRAPRRLWALAVLALPVLSVRTAAADTPEAPPMGGRIVYTRAENSQWDLFAADANGDNETRLTETEDTKLGRSVVGEDQPRWSPDGRQIAFTTFDKEGENGSIWRIPFAGGTPTPIVEDDGTGGDPAWSPDGARIAYSGKRAGAGPSTLDIKVWSAGQTRVVVDSADRDERRPDWTPDGRRLLYESAVPVGATSGTEDWGLRVVGADGTGDGPLIDWPGSSERLAHWSPDGRLVAFIAGHYYGFGTLCVLDTTTGEIRQLVRGAAGPSTWAPDGSRLIFYNTNQSGPEPVLAQAAPVPDVRAQQPQQLGLYVITLADRSIARLRGAAGGARAEAYEWGYSADWSAGTPTPTPTATNTPTPTNTPTITPSPTRTATATATPRPALYLPLTLDRAAPEAKP